MWIDYVNKKEYYAASQTDLNARSRAFKMQVRKVYYDQYVHVY